MALEFASEDLKADIEVANAAVNNNGMALEFASEDLKANIEVTNAAVKQNREAKKFVKKLACTCNNSDNTILDEKCSNCGKTLPQPQPPPPPQPPPQLPVPVPAPAPAPASTSSDWSCPVCTLIIHYHQQYVEYVEQ